MCWCYPHWFFFVKQIKMSRSHGGSRNCSSYDYALFRSHDNCVVVVHMSLCQHLWSQSHIHFGRQSLSCRPKIHASPSNPQIFCFCQLLGNDTFTKLIYFPHDRHRAKRRHKRSQPRKARSCALMTHHPAWVSHHTGGSRSTPTTSVSTTMGTLCVTKHHYPLHNFFNVNCAFFFARQSHGSSNDMSPDCPFVKSASHCRRSVLQDKSLFLPSRTHCLLNVPDFLFVFFVPSRNVHQHFVAVLIFVKR